jgi:hypothetical protein
MSQLRTREEIRARLSALKSNPVPDKNVELNIREWNVPELERQAKIEILEWVLDGWKSDVDIYRKYRDFQHSSTTHDEQGDRTRIRIRAQTNALEWVMKDNTDDPRSFPERLTEVSTEILHLGNDARAHHHDKIDTSVPALAITDATAETIEDDLHQLWRALQDLKSDLDNDNVPTDNEQPSFE